MTCSRITVTLPTPCGEAWEAMQPVPGGRHCASCAKTVVDLRRLSDADLFRFFENPANRGTCCRLSETQLNRALLPPHTPAFWQAPLRRAAALLLSLQALTTAALAQKSKRPHPTLIAPGRPANDPVLKGRVLGLEETVRAQDLQLAFRVGPGPSVPVRLDSAGRFELPLPHGFRGGVISWPEQPTDDGDFLAGTFRWDPGRPTDSLVVHWRRDPATVLREASLTVSAIPRQYERSYGGLPAPEYHPTKPTLWRRLTVPFRKKRL